MHEKKSRANTHTAFMCTFHEQSDIYELTNEHAPRDATCVRRVHFLSSSIIIPNRVCCASLVTWRHLLVVQRIAAVFN